MNRFSPEAGGDCAPNARRERRPTLFALCSLLSSCLSMVMVLLRYLLSLCFPSFVMEKCLLIAAAAAGIAGMAGAMAAWMLNYRAANKQPVKPALGGMVLGLVVTLYVFAIPPVYRTNTGNLDHVCIKNLALLDGAKKQWAMDFHKDSSALPLMAELCGSTNYIKSIPTCPAGGTYTLNEVCLKPECSLIKHTATWLTRYQSVPYMVSRVMSDAEKRTLCLQNRQYLDQAVRLYAEVKNQPFEKVILQDLVGGKIKLFSDDGFTLEIVPLECPSGGGYTLDSPTHRCECSMHRAGRP